MLHTLRTRFKKEIVAEFLPPSRPTKQTKVMIMCGGAPAVPSQRYLLKFFSKKGFWVFFPRYRGSWESDGVFLRKSPERDILDIIDSLPKGFVSIWDGQKYKLRPDEICILAGSFGGPAGILASRDKRVKKVIAVAPVLDWQRLGKAEPMDVMALKIPLAFGQGYRFRKKEWAKLSTGTFYNPVAYAKEINGSKLFIFQAKNDDTVPYRIAASFAKKTGAKLKLLHHGGHIGMSAMIDRYWPEISKFLKAK